MIDLDETNFDEYTQKNTKIIIDFWAPWCGPCEVMGPILEEIENEVDSIIFAKVNVDENITLARKFGIMSIPTFIVVVNNQEVDRIVGVVQKEELKERITN